MQIENSSLSSDLKPSPTEIVEIFGLGRANHQQAHQSVPDPSCDPDFGGEMTLKGVGGKSNWGTQ